MSSNSDCTSACPRLLVGSSRTSTRHPMASARAISTSCCAAGVRSPTGRSGAMSWWPSSAERRDRRLAHPIALDQADGAGNAAAHRLDAQHDILHHAQVRRERQLLVDHRDAGLPRGQRIARRVSGAVEPHLPGVRRQRARENRHQRALPGAVLADERADLAATHGEIHGIERHGRAEGLAHAAHLESRRAHGFSHFDRSGCSSSLASGSFMRSRVISRTPVSIRFSTGWPFRCATIVLTPR